MRRLAVQPPVIHPHPTLWVVCKQRSGSHGDRVLLARQLRPGLPSHWMAGNTSGHSRKACVRASTHCCWRQVGAE